MSRPRRDHPARQRRTRQAHCSTRYAVMALKAMGVERGIVRTHEYLVTLPVLYHIPEVLHGVLYPEAHNNGFQKKKDQPCNYSDGVFCEAQRAR